MERRGARVAPLTVVLLSLVPAPAFAGGFILGKLKRLSAQDFLNRRGNSSVHSGSAAGPFGREADCVRLRRTQSASHWTWAPSPKKEKDFPYGGSAPIV